MNGHASVETIFACLDVLRFFSTICFAFLRTLMLVLSKLSLQDGSLYATAETSLNRFGSSVLKMLFLAESKEQIPPKSKPFPFTEVVASAISAMVLSAK